MPGEKIEPAKLAFEAYLNSEKFKKALSKVRVSHDNLVEVLAKK